MHTIVAFVSQKGGVGKSSLARAFARESAVNGLDVRIADLDTQQGTSVEWSRSRLDNELEPPVAVESFGSAKHAISKARCDLLVIDAPARTSAGTLEIARAADIIVQPSGPSLDDLRPCVREFLALAKAGVPLTKLFVALNHVATEAEAFAAREYLEQAGINVFGGYIPERAAYRAAQNQGRAITETSFESLNESAESMIQKIVNTLKGKK
jgi:chromosome partitioning protein